ncbi:MAG: MFS transporter [Bacteroidales bacterium]|nr:MFS transporter [Bacteroidales bacterium]
MANLLRDNKGMRWGMLGIISLVMFAAYFASDNIFAVETTLQGPLFGITGSEYSSLAGAYSIFNVYLFMLIIGGLILDKMGIRFTGIMSTVLMVVGVGMMTYSFYNLKDLVAAGASMDTINFLGSALRKPVLPAVVGMGIYGVGAEIAGITATKAIAKWFVGYEMALAMGLQLALARLGTGLAYGATPAIVKAATGNVGVAVLVGLIMLCAGLLLFFLYCVNDKKLDKQIAESGAESGSESSAEDEFSFKDVVAVIKNPAFWMIAFLCLLFYAAVNPFLKYSTGMMVNKFGIDQTLAGLFPMILPMGCIVLTPIFGGIYDKKGHGADLMVLGALIITAVHFIFSFLPEGTVSIIPLILMVCLGIGFSLLPSAMWPSVAKIIPAKQLGTAMALTFYIQNIGFIFVPKAINAIQNGTSGYFWFSIFFACLGVSAILLALGIKLLDKKKNYGLQIPNIQK